MANLNQILICELMIAHLNIIEGAIQEDKELSLKLVRDLYRMLRVAHKRQMRLLGLEDALDDDDDGHDPGDVWKDSNRF